MVNTKYMMVIGVVILVLVFVHIIARGQDVELAGSEGFQGGSGAGPRFVMYYADWCPHCQSVKPAFQEFVSSGFSDAGKKVAVEMVEEKSIPAEVKSTIQGYPTFVLYKADGSTVEYHGARDVSAMKDFIGQNM
jgi:thiol-disulfide isomerase/thioredoxin